MSASEPVDGVVRRSECARLDGEGAKTRVLRNAPSDSFEPTPLRTYVAVLARRKWLFLAVVVTVPVAAVLVSLMGSTLYEGRAQVLLSDRDLAGVLTGAQGGGQVDLDRVIETQARVARTPDLARRVLRAAGTSKMTADEFLEASAVEPLSDTNVLDFTVIDADPQLAARLATEYAEEFVLYTRAIETAAIDRALKGVTAELARLTRQGRRDSPLYERLADEAQTLRTMAALQTSRAQLLRRAEDAEQVEPRPKRAAAFGLLAALLLGVGVIALLEALETRVRSELDIPERLGIPLLGRLSEPPRHLRRNRELAVLREPDGAEAEAFRILRANVEYANAQRGAKTIMLTSSVRGEGKSTTAANLAASFARMGKRVVLVDLDFRRPSQQLQFGLNGAHGVSDVALGRVPLEEALAEVPIGSGMATAPRRWAGGFSASQRGTSTIVASTAVLEVLPTGATPNDVGEFIGRGGVRDVLQALSERADIVFIDAPPALEVSDPMTLMTEVDAVVIVARMGVVRYPMLGELRRILDASSVSALGVVITGADVMSGYGSYSQYGGQDVESDQRVDRAAVRVVTQRPTAR